MSLFVTLNDDRAFVLKKGPAWQPMVLKLQASAVLVGVSAVGILLVGYLFNQLM